MIQVSRDSNLKIPKKLENYNGTENSVEDKVAVKQAIATAENKKFNKKQIKEFFSFLTAKEIVRWKNMNAYTNNK